MADSPIVLVVDDELPNRVMLREYFEMHGCRVLEAENGGDAFLAAQKEKPQLIIMDINMPNVHGVSAVNVFQEVFTTADIPVIIFTGLDEDCLSSSITFGPKLRFMRKPGDLREMWAWASEMMAPKSK